MDMQAEATTNNPTTPSSDTKQHPILSSDTQAQLDQYCSNPQHSDNTVKLLASGQASYQYRWQLIQGAQHSIHIVAFSLMMDETSKRLRDELLKKLEQGVEVKLIFDDAVMWSTFSSSLVKELVNAGAEAIRYHKLFSDLLPDFSAGHPFKQMVQIGKLKLKRRFHEKYMIIDGQEVILGGINWGNKYAYGGIDEKAWRDTDVYLRGDVVNDIQQQFNHDFARYLRQDEVLNSSLSAMMPDVDTPKPKTPSNRAIIATDIANGDDQIRYIAHKPYDNNELALTHAYLLMIQKAERYIYWGCHGIRPPRLLIEALGDAVKRGVTVKLFTNSKQSAKTLMMRGLMGWMYWESSLHYKELMSKGIEVYEWLKPGAFHSKNMVIDDVFASVGSYNLARGSTFHHTESNVFVTGGEFPIQVRQQFNEDAKSCHRIRSKELYKVKSYSNPADRPLNERNLLVDDALVPDSLKEPFKQLKKKQQSSQAEGDVYLASLAATANGNEIAGDVQRVAPQVRPFSHLVRSGFLKVFGDIKWFYWPLFFLYDPGSYKVRGFEIRELIDKIEPGDILLRGYDNYLDGAFIPGYFSHAGLYLGPVDESDRDAFDDELVAKQEGYFYAGKQMVIHAMAEGVFMEDLIDFCRCDRMIVLRLPHTLMSQCDAQASEREQAAMIDIEHALAKLIEQNQPVDFEEQAFPVIKEVALQQLGKDYDFDFNFKNYNDLSCTEFVQHCIKALIPCHGIQPIKKSYVGGVIDTSIIEPDAYISPYLHEVWRSRSVDAYRIHAICETLQTTEPEIL